MISLAMVKVSKVVKCEKNVGYMWVAIGGEAKEAGRCWYVKLQHEFYPEKHGGFLNTVW